MHQAANPNLIKREELKTMMSYHMNFLTTLDKEELGLLREGLKKKLDSLEKEYGNISHRNTFDTLVSRNYKRGYTGRRR